MITTQANGSRALHFIFMIETRRLDIIIPVCRTRSSFPGGGFFGASLFFPATIVFTRLRTQPVAAPELVT